MTTQLNPKNFKTKTSSHYAPPAEEAQEPSLATTNAVERRVPANKRRLANAQDLNAQELTTGDISVAAQESSSTYSDLAPVETQGYMDSAVVPASEIGAVSVQNKNQSAAQPFSDWSLASFGALTGVVTVLSVNRQNGSKGAVILNNPLTGDIQLSGLLQQGATLQATPRLVDADGLGPLNYQWYANGVAISGAVNSSLVLTQAQVGKTITVTVSFVDGLGTLESLSSASSTTVINQPDVLQVSLEGLNRNGLTPQTTLRLGDVLRVTLETDEALTPSGNGSNEAFVLLQLDSKQVTALYQPGQSSGNRLVFEYVVDHGSFDASGGVSLASLTLNSGSRTWVGVDAGLALNTALPAAAANSLVLDSSPIAVTVLNNPLTGDIQLSGLLQQGATLQATPRLVDADGLGPLNYQWYANGVAISGAVNSSLVLTQAQVGKTITVTVSFVDGLGTLESLSSASSTTVINQPDVLQVSLEGLNRNGLTPQTTLRLGDVLRVTLETDEALTPSGNGSNEAFVLLQLDSKQVTALYQPGQSSGNRLVFEYVVDHGSFDASGGVSLASLTLNSGSRTWVGVDAGLALNTALPAAAANSLVLDSSPIAVTVLNNPLTGDIQLSGLLQQGATLQATPRLVDADGLGPLNYQWYANGVAISGAVNSSLVLTQAQVGKTITVTVSFVDGLGTLESLSSASSTTIINQPDVLQVSLEGLNRNGLTPQTTLRLGDVLRVTLETDEALTPSGNGSNEAFVLLQLDSKQVTALYQPGQSSGNRLVFEYVVDHGSFDASGGVSLASLTLNSGSRTWVGVDAGLTLNTALPAAAANSLVLDSSPIALTEVTSLNFMHVSQPSALNQALENGGNGGLSGIDYDAFNGRWYLITDSKSTPRLLETTATMDVNGRINLDLSANAQSTSLGAANSFDGEAVRVWNDASGLHYFLASEGLASQNLQPQIQERGADGTLLKTFTLPANLVYTDGITSGPRNNFVFEGLTLSKDGNTLFVALEQPLATDGNSPTLLNGGLNRIVAFDRTTGLSTEQYAYQSDPIFVGQNQSVLAPSTTSFNGISEILSIDNDSLLVLERTVSSRTGFGARIYQVDLSNQAQVGVNDILTSSSPVLQKTLLVDLQQSWASGLFPQVMLNGTVVNGASVLQNLEGMSWGPQVNGADSLLLISDNNFNANQFAQVWQFAVI